MTVLTINMIATNIYFMNQVITGGGLIVLSMTSTIAAGTLTPDLKLSGCRSLGAPAIHNMGNIGEILVR